MYFKQILNEECGCSSYIIASRQSREAAVIDPAIDIDQYLELARHRDFVIKLAIDTHIHADHVSGARKLAAATGATVCMHESADVLFPFRPLVDGERLELGQLILEILHTPGHRPESISILVTNPPRGNRPSMVLTGDALFVGDVGRPDFGGAEGAEQQWASVHRLLQFDDYVEVFPAHFEGSCGKGMCGRPSTTIGFERRYNPLLQLSREDFVKAASEIPARPLNMAAIVATNRGEAEYEWAQPHTVDHVPTVSITEADTWIAQHQPVVVDVREPAEYETGHIAGAISIPQADLATDVADLPRERDYLIVCAGGVRSLRAAHYLLWLGFPRVTSLDGGTTAWLEAGKPVEGAREGANLPSNAPAGQERYFHATP